MLTGTAAIGLQWEAIKRPGADLLQVAHGGGRVSWGLVQR